MSAFSHVIIAAALLKPKSLSPLDSTLIGKLLVLPMFHFLNFSEIEPQRQQKNRKRTIHFQLSDVSYQVFKFINICSRFPVEVTSYSVKSRKNNELCLQFPRHVSILIPTTLLNL
jgi:hypothetical protein